MTNLYNPAAVVVILTAIAAGLGCSGNRQVRKDEKKLRQELFVLRSEIGQFTVDHLRPPDSLSQLVTTGYIKRDADRSHYGEKEHVESRKSGESVGSSQQVRWNR